jgi:broad specificity phosphatase PhoE
VVVVSHVSPIKAAVAWALGVGDEVTWRLFVAPASLTRIALGDRGPVLHTFNEVAHL